MGTYVKFKSLHVTEHCPLPLSSSRCDWSFEYTCFSHTDDGSTHMHVRAYIEPHKVSGALRPAVCQAPVLQEQRTNQKYEVNHPRRALTTTPHGMRCLQRMARNHVIDACD